MAIPSIRAPQPYLPDKFVPKNAVISVVASRVVWPSGQHVRLLLALSLLDNPLQRVEPRVEEPLAGLQKVLCDARHGSDDG